MPGDLLHQHVIKRSSMFVGFRLYLQKTAVHVFSRKSGAVFDQRGFIFRIMMAEKLVYKGFRGSIKDKYSQQHDSQYPI